MTTQSPIIKINLRPKPKSRYFVVLKVFATRKDLLTYRTGDYEGEKKFEACFVYEPDEKTKKLGEVWCYMGSANPASLAHELIHVALEYLRRIKKDDLRQKRYESMKYDDRPEEILCYAVQEMLDQALTEIGKRVEEMEI